MPQCVARSEAHADTSDPALVDVGVRGGEAGRVAEVHECRGRGYAEPWLISLVVRLLEKRPATAVSGRWTQSESMNGSS